LVAILLAGTTLGGFAVGQTTADRNTPPVNPAGVTAPRALPDFSDLVARVKPAVVSITVRAKAEHEGHGPMGSDGPRQRHGRGSGFIVAPEGTIVTNHHVIKDAETVSVTLDDGKTLAAKVVGRDPRTDIAVLKVSADKPLPYILLGNSRDVRPGEWVIAMGNPFGLGGTVTAGIVSAVGRDIGAGPYDRFIQIDAPINQGNSGGPLFTQDGAMVGMNTAILSPHGGSVGIGFAVPSDMIRTVTAEIERQGYVTRGYVGVETQPLTQEMAKALGLSAEGGALLAGVRPEGPAAEAGLKPGDVIRGVNATPITSPRDLAVAIAALKPGEQANLRVLREGEAKEITLTIAEMPSDQMAAMDRGGPHHGPRIGAALAPLTPEARARLDVPAEVNGALVHGVRPGSPAQTAGLRAGDVILGVGGRDVANPREATQAIGAALRGKEQAVALRVLRDGATRFIGVTVERKAG
jgi:serine protease Do